MGMYRKQPQIPRSGLAGQRGATLVIALVMLLILTLLGTTAMQSTTLEERMAGNTRDRNVAFQAAEAALREAERVLAQPVLPPFDGTGGRYQPTLGAGVRTWESVNWTDGSAVTVYSEGSLAGVSGAPAYIIEELPPVFDTSSSVEAGTPLIQEYYRVTARAAGATTGAVVILQTTYKR